MFGKHLLHECPQRCFVRYLYPFILSKQYCGVGAIDNNLLQQGTHNRMVNGSFLRKSQNTGIVLGLRDKRIDGFTCALQQRENIFEDTVCGDFRLNAALQRRFKKICKPRLCTQRPYNRNRQSKGLNVAQLPRLLIFRCSLQDLL